jgi:hypothetical protein
MDVFEQSTSISNISEKFGSPNVMYSAFLLFEAHEYMKMMRESPDLVKNVDAGTAAYIAHYPDRTTKDKLFKLYAEEKDKPGNTKVTASIIVISEMMSYLTDVMEWTQKSYGGF